MQTFDHLVRTRREDGRRRQLSVFRLRPHAGEPQDAAGVGGTDGVWLRWPMTPIPLVEGVSGDDAALLAQGAAEGRRLRSGFGLRVDPPGRRHSLALTPEGPEAPFRGG